MNVYITDQFIHKFFVALIFASVLDLCGLLLELTNLQLKTCYK